MAKELTNLIEKEDSLVVPNLEFNTKFSGGAGFTRYMGLIAKASLKHSGEVYLENSKGKTTSCKEILMLMDHLEEYYCSGEKLRLVIEKKSDYARELAGIISGYLTTENVEELLSSRYR